jgi:hypothetical protein
LDIANNRDVCGQYAAIVDIRDCQMNKQAMNASAGVMNRGGHSHVEDTQTA